MANIQSESAALRKKAESLLSKLNKQQTKGEKLDLEPVKAIFKDLFGRLEKLETSYKESDSLEKEPEETQNQFWQLLNFAPAGFLVLNSNGVILQANATFARIAGQSIEKLLQTPFIELIHPDDKNVYNSQLKSMKHLSGNEIEIRIRGYNDYLWAIVSGQANRALTGSEDYEGSMLFAVTDISYKKRVEKEEKLLCQRINNFQQAESLGLLASGMAHDFNNILTVIMGNAEMLEINNKQDDLQLFIRGIVSASGKAAKLVGQILDYSGEGQSKIEKLDANHLIKDISAFLRSFVPTTIGLSFELEKSEARIECDPEQLKKLLINATINAYEAIGKEYGKIAVKTTTVELGPDKQVNFILEPESAAGKFLCIEIADSGCGMTNEVKSRIFEPFFTTKPAGRGLSLAGALGTIKRHFGGIAVSSEPGKGTSFRLYFPITQLHNEDFSIQLHSDRSHEELKMSGTIMLIDDEEEVRTAGQNILEQLGFQVKAFADGCQALKHIIATSDPVEIAMVDLTMPKMNGLDFFMELRKLGNELPVLFCSGYTRNVLPADVSKNSLVGFIQKPYNLKNLRREIARLITRNRN
ncbi:MAG: hypothetical protein A2W80_16305 [Candidatus Riflebacteria bacterium GWC2_50_8]|nr:MAG: hypothetical protein A2W80_16305 [Candidatus Riflebacteria bacterium GWC2_50_8]